MSIITDYIRDIRKNLRHMEVRERDAVLKEIRQHLDDETARLSAEDPSLSSDEAAIKATHAFGDPKDIGVAYGGEESIGVIDKSTGKRLLEVALVTGRVAGKAAVVTGRGIKGALKILGLIILVVLGVSTILIVAGLYFAEGVIDTFQDDIRENVPRPLYGYSQSWSDGDPETDVVTERFDVRPGVKEFWIDLSLSSESGCASITLTDPTGDTRMSSGNICNGDDFSRGFNFAEKGEWAIQYTFVAYSGSVDVEAWYFEETGAA